MKKVLFSAACLLFLAVIGFAQKDKEFFPQLRLAGMGKNMHLVGDIIGGSEGKMYQCLINCSKSQKEVVAKTLGLMMERGYIDSTSIPLDEISDETKMYTTERLYMDFGISLRSGNMFGRGGPITLSYDYTFEFGPDGVMITVGNFKEEMFLLLHCTASADGKGASETHQRYLDFANEAANTDRKTSGWGKFMTKVDKVMGNKEDVKEAEKHTVENYRETEIEQFKLFKEMVEKGEAKWYLLDSAYTMKYADGETREVHNYLEEMKKNPAYKGNAGQYWEGLIKKTAADSILYDVTATRWEREIRWLFDGLFIDLAEELDGKIEGIVEDGTQTWQRVGELVVPTDEKKKAKYIKKGRSFTDFDSYDD